MRPEDTEAAVSGEAMMPLMTDEQLKAAIERLPGERVTEDYIKSRIFDVSYLKLNATVTVCNITLDNAYSVRGESACVDPANYREEIGRKIAYDDAFDKLWPLFGFLLAEARHARDDPPKPPAKME